MMRWNVLWLVGAVGCSSVSMGENGAELADSGALEGRTLRSEGDAFGAPLEPDAGTELEADSAPASEPEAAAPACPTWFRDADGDGYGDPSDGLTTCEGQPEGYVRDSTDCYDQNPKVYPHPHLYCVRAPADAGPCLETGSAAPPYYGEHRGDGSFDYNCDGEQSPAGADVGIGVVVCPGQPPASTFVPPCGEEGYFTSFDGAGDDAKQGWGTCDGQGITVVAPVHCI